MNCIIRCFLCACVLGSGLLAMSSQVIASNQLAVPNVSQPPVIDGTIGNDEWAGASGGIVSLDPNTSHLAAGQYHGSFRITRFENKLYILYVTRNMTSLPVGPSWPRRDGDLLSGDAIELLLNAGDHVYRIAVNHTGAIADSRDGDSAWNADATAECSDIGTEYEVGIERGFITELEINLDSSDMPMPVDGDQWGLQISRNFPQRGVVAVWNALRPSDEAETRAGKMTWGGEPTRIESIVAGADNSVLTITGQSRKPVNVKLSTTQSDKSDTLASGRFINEVTLPLDGDYTVAVTAENLSYAFHGERQRKSPFVIYPSPSRESFFVTLELLNRSSEEFWRNVGLVDVVVLHEGRVRWKDTVDIKSLSKPYEKWIDYSAWGEGACVLEVQQANGGDILARQEFSIPDKPVWASYELPNLPEIPDIFSPVVASVSSAEVWGREFAFGRSPFVDQITTQGIPVLAGPVILRGQVNGQPLKFKLRSWDIIDRSDASVTYRAQARDRNVNLSVVTRVEFDGFMEWRYEIAPSFGPVKISKLRLVVPVKSEVATLHSSSPGAEDYFRSRDMNKWFSYGNVPDSGMTRPFVHYFWVGNQSAGIQWFSETNQNWSPDDPNKAIELIREKDTTALVINFVGSSDRVIREPLAFTCGVIPTPVRPRPAKWDTAATANRMLIVDGFAELITPKKEQAIVMMPISRQDVVAQGCIEMKFRVDWEPSASDLERIQLYRQTNGWGGRWLKVEWIAQSQSLRVTHRKPNRIDEQVAEVPVEFKKGQWYSLAMNYAFGSNLQLYLNGEQLCDEPLSGPALDWVRKSQREIGGHGRLSVAGWCFSNAPKAPIALKQTGDYVPDATTQHLDNLEYDPTVMRATNPQVGYLSPGYLTSNWTYDAQARALVAGPDGPTQATAEYYAKEGINTAIVFNWSNKNEGDGDAPKRPAAMKQAMELSKKLNMKLVPYSPHGIVDSDPSYEDYKWEFSFKKLGTPPDPFWNRYGIIHYEGPMNEGFGVWKRTFWMIDKMLSAGCAGVYLDGQIYPHTNANQLFLNETPNSDAAADGLFASSQTNNAQAIDINTTRKYLWTMYKLVKHYRPDDGVFDVHASSGWSLPTLTMATNVVNGESLFTEGNVAPPWQNRITLDKLAAGYSGLAYGFNADALFMPHLPVDPEYGVAATGLNGFLPRTTWGMLVERSAGVWSVYDQFNVEDAQWFSYTDKNNPIKTNREDVYVSSYIHQGQRALALVANWSDTEVTADIQISPEVFANNQTLYGKLMNWNRPLTIKSNTIKVQLRPRQLNFIWIDTHEVF